MSATLGPRTPVRDTSPGLPDPGGRGDYRPTHACPLHVDATAGVLPGALRFDGCEQEAAAREALHREPSPRCQEDVARSLRDRRRRVEPARPRRRGARPFDRPPGGGRTAGSPAPQGRRRPGGAGPGDRARRARRGATASARSVPASPRSSAGSSARWSWCCRSSCSSPRSGCSAGRRDPSRGAGWSSAGCP